MKRKVEEQGNDGGELWEIVGQGLAYSLMVDDDIEFRGLWAGRDLASGDLVAISSRNSSEISRWATMPSIARFPKLRWLDLHKNRYIRQLDASVCDLSYLDTLILTRCERLMSLPPQIGNLRLLREVCSRSMLLLSKFRPTHKG